MSVFLCLNRMKRCLLKVLIPFSRSSRKLLLMAHFLQKIGILNLFSPCPIQMELIRRVYSFLLQLQIQSVKEVLVGDSKVDGSLCQRRNLWTNRNL
nr:hypothetical protein Iba_chr02cCG15620 [Ipomoea batatas]